eukprot:CAMPEP_0194494576 /NCGR_PEP_ID=MMETSP0253-20130528/12443_1 /TAXON_ID=2966 /ORGANISM="Noctiluca scintillans" /LENGTH=225 /DNA_ID=CAMNT_0039335715 /DNA_START=59 /DNA_END=733 /DNA_ORIENTATION=-
MTQFSDTYCVLFGGYNGDGYAKDVYKMELGGRDFWTGLITLQWSLLTDLGDTPSARAGHSMISFSNHSGVIFGGYDGTTYLNDTYQMVVSSANATWTLFTNTGDTPYGRNAFSMVELGDGTIVVFGGKGIDGSFNDMYQVELSDTSAYWTQLTNFGDTPTARGGHMMMVLDDGSAVLFGGDNGSSCFNDMYQLWRPTDSPTAAPTASPTASPTSAPTASPTSAPT